MRLCHKGWPAAIFRAKFEHWVPFDFDYQVVDVNMAPVVNALNAELDQEEAERRHVLATVTNGIGMQTTSKDNVSCLASQVLFGFPSKCIRGDF